MHLSARCIATEVWQCARFSGILCSVLVGGYMSQLNKPVTTSKQNKVKEIHLLAIFTTITSLVFWAFFSWSKTDQFAAVNPFAYDPYDAIGSFAFQIAVAISILSLARSFQQRKNLNSLQRSPYIMRGIGIALFVTVITILGDSIAVTRQYSMVSSSIFGMYLLIGLGALTLLTLINGVLFIKELRLSPGLHATGNISSSLGEALHDVYLMVLSPLSKIFPKVENIDQWLQKNPE
jgi:hypothetical protein